MKGISGRVSQNSILQVILQVAQDRTRLERLLCHDTALYSKRLSALPYSHTPFGPAAWRCAFDPWEAASKATQGDKLDKGVPLQGGMCELA